MNRERLERYVLAIASGWYAAPTTQPQGENGYCEAPRVVPELTNIAIVDAAVDLIKRVDQELGDDTIELDVVDLEVA